MIALVEQRFLPGNTQGTALEFRESESSCGSDLGVKIEESFQAGAELFLDLFLAALKDVHGDVRLIAVLELDGRFAYFDDLVGGQKAKTIYECQVGHATLYRAESFTMRR